MGKDISNDFQKFETENIGMSSDLCADPKVTALFLAISKAPKNIQDVLANNAEKWLSEDSPMFLFLDLLSKGLCFECSIGTLNGSVECLNVTKMSHKQMSKAMKQTT